jgi:hypothetical protein
MPKNPDDAAVAAAKAEYRRAEFDSHCLKLAIRDAIKRQAQVWGIRTDQAQALLLDRKAIA